MGIRDAQRRGNEARSHGERAGASLLEMSRASAPVMGRKLLSAVRRKIHRQRGRCLIQARALGWTAIVVATLAGVVFAIAAIFAMQLLVHK